MASSNEIAQIELIDKELNNLNSSITNTSTNYLKLVKTIADNTVVLKEQAVTFDSVSKAQKQTTDNSKQLDALTKQLAASEAKLKQLEDSRIETLIKNRMEIQNTTKEITLKLKAQQAEKGSTEQLIAVNAILENRLKSVNQTTEEGKKKSELLRSAIDRNNETIKNNSSALTAQKINIGNYGSALDGLKNKFDFLGNSASSLPGPLGSASKGLMAVGKEMWALVANPIGALIAGIVIVFTSLYSIFTSTASGGKLVKEVMASISAIFDVVKQRATVLIDAFKALFSGEFSKAADLFKKSVSGISDQMADAAREAWNLVEAQSALNKELVFHTSEEAKEVNMIQKLIYASKDKTKSDGERLASLKEAMKLSKEQSEREVEYAKRQYIIDTDKAALKAKVSGVTADQLRAFIELDAEEQKAALNSSESLKKMWDLIGGSDNFKPLEESYVKVIDADTKYFEGNKRNQAMMTGLIESIAQQREEDAKDQKDKQEKAQKEREEAAKKEYERQQKLSASIEKLVGDQVDAQEKSEEEAVLESIKLGEKAYADRARLKEKEEEEDKKRRDKMIDEETRKAEKIRDIQFQMASEAINGIFDLGSIKRDDEIAELEKEKQAKLSNSKLTADQKAKIEEDYAKKIADIKTKQAKADKKQALFNIALNTAMGSMKAVAEFPLTGGMPFLAWVIAAGALQEALAMAQPIPKFAKGTDSAPVKGIFGEAGRELMFLRSGEITMAEKPTYFEGSKFKGARIFSNPVTERMISQSEHSGFTGQTMTDDRIIKGLESVERAIKNKPVQIVNSNYDTIGHGTSNHQTIYLNKLTHRN